MRRNFALFASARAVSGLGDGALPIALTAVLIQRGDSAIEIGLVFAASILPTVLLIPVAGTLADRLGPLRLMIVSDYARCLIQVVVAILLITGSDSLGIIVLSQFAYGIAAAAFEPGLISLIPRLTENFLRGNSAIQAIRAITTIGGPALAGVLLLFGSPGWLLITIDAVSFLLGAVLLQAIRLVPQSRVADRGHRPARFWGDLREGWHQFTSRRWLWTVISVFAIFGVFVFGPQVVLGASIVSERFGTAEYGLYAFCLGVGALAGSLLVSKVRSNYPLRLAALSLSLVSLPLLALAVAAPLPIVLASAVIGGAGRTGWSVIWVTTEQRMIPADVLNRVYAFDVLGSVAFLPVGRAAAGFAAATFGSTAVLLWAAAVCILGCIFLYAVREVREIHAPLE